MAEDILSIGGQVPSQTQRQSRPTEDFQLDDALKAPQDRIPMPEGIGPAFILDLSDDAREALRAMRDRKKTQS